MSSLLDRMREDWLAVYYSQLSGGVRMAKPTQRLVEKPDQGHLIGLLHRAQPGRSIMAGNSKGRLNLYDLFIIFIRLRVPPGRGGEN